MPLVWAAGRKRCGSSTNSETTVSFTCLPRPTPLAIPADWTPEQALVVIELLDDLRERIWAISAT
jgi:hypothetical protein